MNKNYSVPHLEICSSSVDFAPSVPLSAAYCYRVEEEIKRSRFITSIGHATDRESAKFFIDSIRSEFPDATHNCWAYAAGAPGDTAQIGQSDDGEPHGTAGRPMLNMLLHGMVGEIVVVITRYFGGIKLGTGGLVRAYQGGVALALKDLPLCEKIETSCWDVIVDYNHMSRIHHLLPQFQAKIVQETFSSDACYRVELPITKVLALENALMEATDGLVLFTPASEE